MHYYSLAEVTISSRTGCAVSNEYIATSASVYYHVLNLDELGGQHPASLANLLSSQRRRFKPPPLSSADEWSVFAREMFYATLSRELKMFGFYRFALSAASATPSR
jgi:hypothetical protein